MNGRFFPSYSNPKGPQSPKHWIGAPNSFPNQTQQRLRTCIIPLHLVLKWLYCTYALGIFGISTQQMTPIWSATILVSLAGLNLTPFPMLWLNIRQPWCHMWFFECFPVQESHNNKHSKYHNYTSVDPKQSTVSQLRLKPVLLISECFCSRCGHTNQHPPFTWRETTGDKTTSEPKKPTTPTNTKAAKSKVALRTPTVNCFFVLHLTAITSCQDWCLTEWNTSLYKFPKIRYRSN